VDAFLSGVAARRARKAASAALLWCRLRVRTGHGCRRRRCTRRAKPWRDREPLLSV